MAHPNRTLKKESSSSSGSFLQSRTRTERGFEETEAALLKDSAAKKLVPSKISDVLSYLGRRNPLPVAVTKTDIVWVMDNVAFRSPNTGGWEAEFVAAVFESKPPARLVDIVGDIATKVGLAKGCKEEATIERRITPFLLDVQPGRRVEVDFAGKERLKIAPGGRNGISSDVKKLQATARDGDIVASRAVVPSGTTGLLEPRTKFAEPEGWAILSDVDDTIKITQTSDPTGILRTTFVDEPTPVAGMPELYDWLRQLVTPQAPWFYLSASPYNLYPFLRGFTDRYFPSGQLILRDSSWMTISGLLSNLTMGTLEYKTDRIRKVHSWLPKRKMILIGDSTQSDPEAYGEIYREFPGWIKLILIRKVTDFAAIGKTEKNDPARFEEAFQGVPKEDWFVFEDPSECRQIIGNVIAAK